MWLITVKSLNCIIRVTKKHFLIWMGGLVICGWPGPPNRVSTGADLTYHISASPLHICPRLSVHMSSLREVKSVLPELSNHLCTSFNKTNINNCWIFKFSGGPFSLSLNLLFRLIEIILSSIFYQLSLLPPSCSALFSNYVCVCVPVLEVCWKRNLGLFSSCLLQQKQERLF